MDGAWEACSSCALQAKIVSRCWRVSADPRLHVWRSTYPRGIAEGKSRGLLHALPRPSPEWRQQSRVLDVERRRVKEPPLFFFTRKSPSFFFFCCNHGGANIQCLFFEILPRLTRLSVMTYVKPSVQQYTTRNWAKMFSSWDWLIAMRTTVVPGTILGTIWRFEHPGTKAVFTSTIWSFGALSAEKRQKKMSGKEKPKGGRSLQLTGGGIDHLAQWIRMSCVFCQLLDYQWRMHYINSLKQELPTHSKSCSWRLCKGPFNEMVETRATLQNR